MRMAGAENEHYSFGESHQAPVNYFDASRTTFFHHVPKVGVELGGSSCDIQGLDAGTISDHLMVEGKSA